MSNHSPQADAEIIARCHNGHPEAFGLLYDAYVRQIFAFIYYRTHHRQTAEDLTSVTFLKALHHLNQFNGAVGSFSSWLYRIARNTVTDHYRTTHPQSDIADAYDLAAPGDIEDLVHARTLLERVRGELGKLKPEQREIVILRVWQGLPYREIAQILGKNEASCKMSFSRTIRALRAQLPATALVLAGWLLRP